MTQMHAHRAHAASLDDKCLAFGRVVGSLKFLDLLNSALARSSAAATDIIYPAHAALSPAHSPDAVR